MINIIRVQNIIAITSLLLFSSSSQLIQPSIIFDRQIVQDALVEQLSLWEAVNEMPPLPFVQKAELQRCLGYAESSVPRDYVAFGNVKVKELNLNKYNNKKCKAINITLNKPFARSIYISCDGQIIGYGLAEEMSLYLSKDPEILREIKKIPEKQDMLNEHIQLPSVGRLELREQERNGFVEQYAVYHSPEGDAIFLLDAFYPKQYQERLKRPLGKAISRFVEGWEIYYSNSTNRNIDQSLDGEIESEMD